MPGYGTPAGVPGGEPGPGLPRPSQEGMIGHDTAAAAAGARRRRTGRDRLRAGPRPARLALELPVTAVSQALQASMRVQQKVTELAIKGDQVPGIGPPIEDEPAWATFDEDPPPRRNGERAAPRPRP